MFTVHLRAQNAKYFDADWDRAPSQPNETIAAGRAGKGNSNLYVRTARRQNLWARTRFPPE